MKQGKFCIELDSSTGCIASIVHQDDPAQMNWCSEIGHWGEIHKRNWSTAEGIMGELPERKMYLKSMEKQEKQAVSVYKSDELEVTVTRKFDETGNLVENFRIRNIFHTVVSVNRDTFGIEVPFADSYPGADICMTNRCCAHIWCGHHVAWVNGLKMGTSDINLGLFLTKGAIDCYDQDDCVGGNRGRFILEPESLLLKSGEEYELEWILFWHRGIEDFQRKIETFQRNIKIDAVHYTVFEQENIEFTVSTVSGEKPVVTVLGEKIESEKIDEKWKIHYQPRQLGEHRFEIQVGSVHTWARFMVKQNFQELLEKRVRFIVQHQQCLDPESPLYGAFLVYDNEYDSPYFDYSNGDHNACRERMNIPLLLMKYLQIRNDPEVRAAIDLYIQFMFREFFEETTGEVFNTIGKNRDFVRPYNAPGGMLVLCEMYQVTKDTKYLRNILLLAENYYAAGGKKCYANGLAIGKVIRAFRDAGWKKEEERLMELFQTHVDNIIQIGTSYPPHEVNYEQTIVTPAVQHIADMGLLRENREAYMAEAEKHLKVLERFSGMQPDCYLNEIAIRYWDDYWFGKNRTMGDTLPHHLSCLTARAYRTYSQLSGDPRWMKKAEECQRNCMCLIGDDGRGSAAHIYPYKLNGKRGEFFDPWSNDQDLVLYEALYSSQEMNIFQLS